MTATLQIRVAQRGRLTMTQTATDFPALESDPIEKLAIDTIRTLCIDAVQAANSGHPGTPMALAPVIPRMRGRSVSARTR